jgi:hypothetical protein
MHAQIDRTLLRPGVFCQSEVAGFEEEFQVQILQNSILAENFFE